MYYYILITNCGKLLSICFQIREHPNFLLNIMEIIAFLQSEFSLSLYIFQQIQKLYNFVVSSCGQTDRQTLRQVVVESYSCVSVFTTATFAGKKLR
jgi:hypothetical protein